MRAMSLTFLTALAFLPPAARAAVTETNFRLSSAADLAALCGAQADDKLYTAAQNFCQGFAEGIYRVLVKMDAADGTKTFCLPDPAPTRNQAIAAYVGYVGTDPSAGAVAAEDSLLQFLQHQYPCSATNTGK